MRFKIFNILNNVTSFHRQVTGVKVHSNSIQITGVTLLTGHRGQSSPHIHVTGVRVHLTYRSLGSEFTSPTSHRGQSSPRIHVTKVGVHLICR